MTSVNISDNDLVHIGGQVIIITGASSGIGLATLRRVLKHGGKVFASDVNPLPEPENSSVPFLKVDVTSWTDQVAMFKAAEEKYGKIDHVFANAGIGSSFSLLEDEVDTQRDLLPPKLDTINVNLIGCIYTVKLGIHYLGKTPRGGSIVVTGSASSIARFPQTDYTTTKHAVLGLVRSLYEQLHPKVPIRVNAVAPAWTETAIIPSKIMQSLKEGEYQSPDVVARSVVFLMADRERHGDLLYVDRGMFTELENGKNGYSAIVEAMG